MPSLNDHGKLGAATIPFYVPILIISFVLVLRHGFTRDSGWIFVFIFSIVRILGGALLIAAQLVRPGNTNLYVAASILEAAGLSPLLLATLGFLRTVGKNSFSEHGRMPNVFRLLGLLGIVALALSIYGGIIATVPSDQSKSNTFRHIGSILFAVFYGLLAAVHAVCWLHADTLMKHRRTLLIGISLALPFLGVRVVYTVLASFSGSPIATSTTTTTNSLSKFNLINGDWRIYLVMALVMEYIVVIIYTTVGAMLPLQKDFHLNYEGVSSRGMQLRPPPQQPYDHRTVYPLQRQAAYAA
ncbi:hypothetical protein PILCRDRAFT_818206 [Piloderma croceum F 1598]|uniref:DUF7702 domain-containing protein n=1 Tax=Piloderma croceum (strain F 1598) TaxID=765440 RepID=A0A0C3BEA1_PILCF|nr:hypothetical protein PILCRDRAFT_818206 [Piloderma croceum F 1598]